MAKRCKTTGSAFGGTIDRREFISGVAAVAAGALAPRAWAQAQPASPRRTDVHHHYQSPELTKYLAKYGINVPQYDREPVTRRPWTVSLAIENMDKAGVDIAYTSAATYYTRMADLAKAGGSMYGAEIASSLARESNDYGASVCEESKGRFRLFAVLPQSDVDSSLREIEHAVDTLKAPGFCMGTSVGVTYLGNPKLDPIMEELNRRRAVVYTHPNLADWAVDLVPRVGAPQVWYGNDTTTAITSLLQHEVPERYPDIRWIFSHGGGTLPYLIERYIPLPVAKTLASTPKPGERLYNIRKFYFDTAQVCHAPAMGALKQVAGVSQILFGTDYPWSTLVDHVEGIVDSRVFTPAELNAIYRENTMKLLPPT
jgi:6-methylsalicylate decarboxylase